MLLKIIHEQEFIHEAEDDVPRKVIRRYCVNSEGEKRLIWLYAAALGEGEIKNEEILKQLNEDYKKICIINGGSENIYKP